MAPGRARQALGAVAAHRAWGKAHEPFIVAGSARRDVFRVVRAGPDAPSGTPARFAAAHLARALRGAGRTGRVARERSG